ncbi:glycosyltransferase [Rhodococcus sp. AB351]|uniref:glycosyltransferase n=1 Tax=Rhodococcus sp. AB351 TaxID=3413280 RepID=UPI003C17E85E
MKNQNSAEFPARSDQTNLARSQNSQVDYLVGGFRIALGPDSNTPGPRTHIVNFIEGLHRNKLQTRLFLASSFPFMGRFSRIRQSDYSSAGSSKVIVADIVRILAALWCGMNVFAKTVTSPAPVLIYERAAVLQSLTSFHAKKHRAFRVVEANGILSRETAQDRKVLRAEKLAAAVERHVLRKADLVVAVSERLKTEIVRFAGVDADRILVVPNGVSESLLTYERQAHEGRVVGFVGSVVKWQNLENIIAMVADVAESARENVRFELVGDGAELSALRRFVQQRGLEDLVTFHGKLPQTEAFELMTRWDIGLAGHQKSSSETMYHSPLKLYEYAALGLSIVCTKSLDARILSESGADVHQFENDTEFVATLSDLISKPLRTSYDIQMSRESVVSDHSWRGRARQVLEVAGIDQALA